MNAGFSHVEPLLFQDTNNRFGTWGDEPKRIRCTDEYTWVEDIIGLIGLGALFIGSIIILVGDF